MTLFYKISDEELAAYLDGMLSKEELVKVDSTMDIETLEILNVSRKAIEEFPTDNVISLPSWSGVTANSIHTKYEPLAMAGFLGDGCDNDDEIYDDKQNNEN